MIAADIFVLYIIAKKIHFPKVIIGLSMPLYLRHIIVS